MAKDTIDIRIEVTNNSISEDEISFIKQTVLEAGRSSTLPPVDLARSLIDAFKLINSQR